MKFVSRLLKYFGRFSIAEIDDEQLWEFVFNGRPLSATLALSVLNKRHKGKILKALRDNECKGASN